MLIAIMGDSYAKVSEMREQAALKEKINILCDYLRLVTDKPDKETYLVYIKPDEEADEGWGGILSSMKKQIARASDNITRAISKRITGLNQDVGELKSANTNMTDKLDEVQSNIQKQEIQATKDALQLKNAIKAAQKQMDKNKSELLETIEKKIKESQASTNEALQKIITKLEA